MGVFKDNNIDVTRHKDVLDFLVQLADDREPEKVREALIEYRDCLNAPQPKERISLDTLPPSAHRRFMYISKHASAFSTEVPWGYTHVYRTVTKEAAEAVNTLDLSIQELRAFYRTEKLSDLAMVHRNWTVEELVDVTPTFQRTYNLFNTNPNMELLIGFYDTFYRYESRRSHLGDGSNLDDNALFYFLGSGSYCLAHDPRVKGDELENIVTTICEDYANGTFDMGQFPSAHRDAVLSNPNLNEDQFRRLRAKERERLQPEFRWRIVTNPAAPADLLDEMMQDRSSYVRSHIAAHPNTSTATLAKLSKMKDLDVAQPALKQLAERETKPMPSRKNMF